MKKGSLSKIVYLMLFILMFGNSVSAVWMYAFPSTFIECDDATVPHQYYWYPIADINFSSINISLDYINYSYSGSAPYYNITFARNISSSAASVQVGGSHSTNLTVDVYNFTASTPFSHVVFRVYTDDGTNVYTSGTILYDYIAFNSTHRRYYHIYNPSDAITDYGLADVNVTFTNDNATMYTGGWVRSNDLFDLVAGGGPTTNISRPPINGTADDTLIELNGFCSLGDDVTNFSADCYADVYGPAGWSLTVTMDFITNNSEIDQSVTATSYTQVNSTYRKYTYEYNPSNDLSTADLGNFSVNVSSQGSNATHSYSNYTLFPNVFEVYELLPVSNVTSVYNATLNSVNFSWGAYNESIFYFNSSSSSWDNNPTYLNDGDINTYSWQSGTHDFHVFDNNTFPWGDDYGTVEQVLIRINTYDLGGSLYLEMTPSYTNGTGTQIDINPGLSAAWYGWYDITDDTNTPTNWNWSGIKNITCTLDPSGQTTYASLVQLKVVHYAGIDETPADAYVVVRSNISTVACPGDGYEVYNGTNNYYNASVDWTTAYFSVFTYNATTMSYSNATVLPYGGIRMNVRNESNTSQWIRFDLEITNEDASQVYSATNLFNASISFADIPYGTNTIFFISNSSYRSRIYYYDLYQNNIYNFSWFLPPIYTPTENGSGDSGGNTTTTRLYKFRVIDENDYPVPDATVEIRRRINASTYMNVSILITNGYGENTVYLVPTSHYKLFINAEGFIDEIADWFPDPDFYGMDYPEIFRIIRNTSAEPTYGFWDLIEFNATRYSNNTIRIMFYDYDSNTTNASFYTYEYYNGSRSLNDTTSITVNSYTFWVTGINNSRLHQVVIHLNHTTLGYETVMISVPYIEPSHNVTEIEAKFVNILGTFRLGYVTTFLLFIPAIVLLAAPNMGSKKHPGLSIILSAGYLGAVSPFIYHPIAIVPFLIVIGVILMMVKGGQMKL